MYRKYWRRPGSWTRGMQLSKQRDIIKRTNQRAVIIQHHLARTYPGGWTWLKCKMNLKKEFQKNRLAGLYCIMLLHLSIEIIICSRHCIYIKPIFLILS